MTDQQEPVQDSRYSPKEDAAVRFILDGEGDRCPECSSDAIRTWPDSGDMEFAHCESCDYFLETGAGRIRFHREMPEWLREQIEERFKHD